MSPPLRETRVPAVQLHRHCCINPEIEKKNKMNFEGTGSYAFSRISYNGINKKGKIEKRCDGIEQNAFSFSET